MPPIRNVGDQYRVGSANVDNNLIFGLRTVGDWLAKVKRERARYLEEKDPTSRADHAINFAFSVASLQEWIFQLHVKNNLGQWPDHQTLSLFDGWARRHCPILPILADLGNAAKHRVVSRPRSGTQSAELGPVGHYIEAEFWPEFSRRLSYFGDIINIRTVIDDDEIITYEVRMETHKIISPEGFKFFISVCDTAIAFWEKFITDHGLR